MMGTSISISHLGAGVGVTAGVGDPGAAAAVSRATRLHDIPGRSQREDFVISFEVFLVSDISSVARMFIFDTEVLSSGVAEADALVEELGSLLSCTTCS